jgi:MFS family permease
MLLIGVISNIANAVILLHASTISELIIAQMIAGLAFMLIIVGSQALISKISELRARETAFGLLSIGASIGLALNPVLGGFLVERFDYRTAFYLVLLFSSMGLLVLGIRDTEKANSLKRSYSLFQLSADLYRRKKVRICMRQKFGGAEAIHKILIDVELQIGDAVANLFDGHVIFIRFKRQGRTFKRAVSHWLIPVQR